MNEQKAPRGIEWTRVWGRRGYTLNPIRGCTHQCRWRMPDGNIAICYAKELAELRLKISYPRGFEEVTFHPDCLEALEDLTAPSGIFIDSMSDLFGVGTKREWTHYVLDVVAEYPQHVFFSLTKNPPALRHFHIPSNLWCGISSPATFMFGKELSHEQQVKWFENALRALGESDAKVKWVSLEPLAIDLSDQLYGAGIDWAVIGAASNGAKKFQPDPIVLRRTLAALHPHPVFFKGNIDRNLANDIAGRWLDNFPDPDTV